MSIKSEDKFYQTFIINGIILSEMNDYHLGKGRKLEDDKQANDFMLMRILWWKDRVKKEARTISLNPTTNIARTRINNLKKFKDCTPILMDNIIDFIKNTFEHTLNLGHTDAYSYLCNIDEPIFIDEFITPTPFETFEFGGDINHFFKQCVECKVIDSKTSLDSFKMAFNGNDLRGFNDFVFKFKQHNHCVYFFDQLNNKKLINYKFVQNNRIIEHLGNIKNVHSKRENYLNTKIGTPKSIEYINDLINSLK